jgi:hypothetical protein
MKELEKSLEFLTDQFLFIQRRRLASQLRLQQLKKRGREDPLTKESHEIFLKAEKQLQALIESTVQELPVWQEWLSYVKGIGKLLAGEIIGGFASAFKDGEGIEHFRTVSQMWAFAGLDVRDGKAPRRIRGQKLTFNSELRSILLGRIAPAFLKAKGGYWRFYNQEKRKLTERFLKEGKRVLPASKLPTLKGKKYEPDNVISEGHLHAMTRRKMIKLFVAHLFEEWRKANDLPEDRKAYVIDILKHPDYIPPFRDK